MEAQQYVREYVRDQRTWRRAVRQPGAERCVRAGENMNGLWEVCRFGSVENAETARFARALRERDPNASANAPSHKTWNGSLKVGSPARTTPTMDVLEVALQRNLKRVGLTIAYNNAATQQRPAELSRANRSRASSSSRGISPLQHEAHWVHQALCDLVVDEKATRAKVVKAQQREWTRLHNLAFLNHMNALLDDEYNGRRAIFREAVIGQKAILDGEQQAFASHVSVSRRQFLVFCEVVGLESKYRQSLTRLEERERSTLYQLVQLLQLESLEHEITSCARRETQLRGMLGAEGNRLH